jgi:hypothetical protein
MSWFSEILPKSNSPEADLRAAETWILLGILAVACGRVEEFKTVKPQDTQRPTETLIAPTPLFSPRPVPEIAETAVYTPIYISSPAATKGFSEPAIAERTEAAYETAQLDASDFVIMRQLNEMQEGTKITLTNPLIKRVIEIPGFTWAHLAVEVNSQALTVARIKNFDCPLVVLSQTGELQEPWRFEIGDLGVSIDPTIVKVWQPEVRVEELEVQVTERVPTLLTSESISHQGISASCEEDSKLGAGWQLFLRGIELIESQVEEFFKR